jgi:putative salt-induced outer membrane protein
MRPGIGDDVMKLRNGGSPRSAALWIAIAVIALLMVVPETRSEEGDERPWKNTTELGFVTTTGNTETENLSFKNTFTYGWTKTSLKFDASMLTAEQTTREASNVGGSLVVDETTESTAENYRLALKLRRELRERLFAYGSANWERDVFSGIDSRYVYGAGVGYRLLDEERQQLAVELGADYTDEQPVGAAQSDTYAGARAAADYEWKFSETAKLSQELEMLWNLEESSDYRINSVTSLTAALTSKLALKTSYTIRYDNEPVVEVLEAPGFDPVLFEFDETDTVLSASLVINF